MAYASWSVVFGEQPSAAKWNILGTNDASFNDGTGIGTNAIAAASLKTNALLLGCTQKTSNFASSSTTAVQVTGLSQAVTIPSGGRGVKITGYCTYIQVAGLTSVSLTIWDGTVGSGTQLAQSTQTQTVNTYQANPLVMAFVTPAAGAKTYNIGMHNSGAVSCTLTASATAPAFILVEAV